jgi:apolipoprotein N-acyltransferase
MASYHPVMGVKILVSLALFAVALLLLAPNSPLHEKRKTWLSVNVVLGLAILLLGAYLRRLWPVGP